MKFKVSLGWSYSGSLSYQKATDQIILTVILSKSSSICSWQWFWLLRIGLSCFELTGFSCGLSCVIFGVQVCIIYVLGITKRCDHVFSNSPKINKNTFYKTAGRRRLDAVSADRLQAVPLCPSSWALVEGFVVGSCFSAC